MSNFGVQPDGSYRKLPPDELLHRKQIAEGVFNQQFANKAAGDLAGALFHNMEAIRQDVGEQVGDRFLLFLEAFLPKLREERADLDPREFELRAITAISMVMTGEEVVDRAIAASCFETLHLEERLSDDTETE